MDVFNFLLLLPIVPQFSLQHSELHNHLNAQVQKQLYPQLPERVSYRAAHGYTCQHHQGRGQRCQRYSGKMTAYHECYVTFTLISFCWLND